MKNIVALSIFAVALIFCQKNAAKTASSSDKAEQVDSTSPKMVSSYIDYKDADGKILKGFAAYNDDEHKHPAVLVIHEWWGNNDYSRGRALQLATLGYVAFAVDMYGNGVTAQNRDDAQKIATPFYTDISLAKKRFDAALKMVKMMPNVDTSRIAVIGYCFGGSQALNMARIGEPIKAVVSFHGGLDLTPITTRNTSAKVLVCNGAADAFVSQASIEKFENEMRDAGFKVDFKNYPNAHHAFTNPKADNHNMENVSYNAAADTASWNDMKTFLSKEL